MELDVKENNMPIMNEGKVPTVIPLGLTGRGKRKRSLPNYADMASGKKAKMDHVDKRELVVFNAEDVKIESATKEAYAYKYANAPTKKSKTTNQDQCDDKSPIEIVRMLESLLSRAPEGKAKLLENVRQFVDFIKITNRKGSIPDEYVSVPYLTRILFLYGLTISADFNSTIEAENMDLDHLAAMSELDGETSFEEGADKSELCDMDPEIPAEPQTEESTLEEKCNLEHLKAVSQISGAEMSKEETLLNEVEFFDEPNVSVGEARSDNEIQIEKDEISKVMDFRKTDLGPDTQDNISDQPNLNLNPEVETVDINTPTEKPKGSAYHNEADKQGEPKFRCTICDKFYVDIVFFKQHIGLKHMGFATVTEWRKPENKQHRKSAFSHKAFERVKTKDMSARENEQAQFYKCLECVPRSDNSTKGPLSNKRFRRTQKDFIENVVMDPSNALFSDLSQLKAHTNSAHPLLEDPMACYYQLPPSKTQTRWRSYKCLNCDVRSSCPKDMIRHLQSESHSCRNEVRRGDRVKAVRESGYLEVIEPPEGPVDVKAEDTKLEGLANNSSFFHLLLVKK